MEKERTSPWLILFRVVFTAALIACIMFIFRNSLENGAQSSARSQAVMQLVNSALAKVHLGPLSEHLIRKLAHFSEFALEGFLLMLCIRVYTKHFVRHMSWPLLGGMTTALMDETIQLHSLNRTSSVVDVWIDMSGVVAGLLFALIILLIVRGVPHSSASSRRTALCAPRARSCAAASMSGWPAAPPTVPTRHS